MSQRTPTAGLGHQIAALVFDVPGELLHGKVGSKSFHIRAVSGGGRGSTVAGVAQSTLTSRMATTALIKDKHGKEVQRGGPLPPGTYLCEYVAHHPKFHECIRLRRDAQALHYIHSPFSMQPIPHHRGDDFFIHGRGELGSDGCIVPLNPIARKQLTHAIRDFPGRVVVSVRGASYVLPAERFDGIRT